MVSTVLIGILVAASSSGADAPQALSKRLDPVSYQRVPLAVVLDHFQQAADMNMSVRWRPLNRAGVFSDSMVTLSLPGADVKTALRETLRYVSDGDTDDDAPDFAVRNGVVIVSTKKDLAADLETRVYDVTDVLSAKLTDREQDELQEAVAALWKQHYHVFSPPWHRQPRNWGREGRSRALCDRSKGPRQRETEDIIQQMSDVLSARRAAELVSLIRASVDPASWGDEPTAASATHFDGRLVIRQTPENHARIASLLSDLAQTVE